MWRRPFQIISFAQQQIDAPNQMCLCSTPYTFRWSVSDMLSRILLRILLATSFHPSHILAWPANCNGSQSVSIILRTILHSTNMNFLVVVFVVDLEYYFHYNHDFLLGEESSCLSSAASFLWSSLFSFRSFEIIWSFSTCRLLPVSIRGATEVEDLKGVLLAFSTLSGCAETCNSSTS